MNHMVSEALKQFKSRWASALFSSIGVMIATAAMVVVSHVSSMMIQQTINTLTMNGGLTFTVYLQNANSGISLQDLDLVFQDIPHVTSYHPISEGEVHLGNQKISIIGSSQLDKIFEINLISGGMINEHDNYPYIVLTKSLDDALNAKGFALEQKTPLILNEGAVEIVGVIKDIKLPLGFADYTDGVALTSHQTFSALFKRLPSKVIVSIDDIENSDTVLLNIQGKFKQLYPQISINAMSPKTLTDMGDSLSSTMNLVGYVMMTICSLLGGIGIMNMTIANINERKSELALRIAFGASIKQIRNMLVTETCILCLSAGVFGIILGLLVTKLIASFAEFKMLVDWIVLLKSLLFCTLVGVIASQYPSHLVKRIPIAYLLKGE